MDAIRTDLHLANHIVMEVEQVRGGGWFLSPTDWFALEPFLKCLSQGLSGLVGFWSKDEALTLARIGTVEAGAVEVLHYRVSFFAPHRGGA